MIALTALLLLAQEEAVELKWTAAPEDKFDLQWVFDESNVRVPGTGAKSELVDKRTVAAELTPTPDEGRFAVALKKVSWIYSNNEFGITLEWGAGGKPPVAQLKMKVDPKASNAQAARTFAEQRVEQMKKLVSEGTYLLYFDPTSRETYITRNGTAARNQSLFDLLFLHSPLPKGTVTNGQTWKENLERVPFNQLVEVKLMNCKVAVTGPGASIKGGFTQPINRSGDRGETISGNFSFNREFTFAKEGCILNSKEEQVLSKKVDAKGADADFYRETSTHSVKQTAVFKKKAAPKPK